MARRMTTRNIEHHWALAPDRHVSYEHVEREPETPSAESGTESRLGPYETRYPVQLGYAAPPRVLA